MHINVHVLHCAYAPTPRRLWRRPVYVAPPPFNPHMRYLYSRCVSS